MPSHIFSFVKYNRPKKETQHIKIKNIACKMRVTKFHLLS